MIYAVIDTNVFVSALFTSNVEAATVKVLNAMLQGRIVPLYNEEIFDVQNVSIVMRNSQIWMTLCSMRWPFLRRMLIW